MEQRIAGAFQPSRAALHIYPAEFAVRGTAESRQIIEAKVHVVAHHQIDEPVPVVIAKSRPR